MSDTPKTRQSIVLNDDGRGSIMIVEGGDSLFVTSESHPDEFPTILKAARDGKTLAEIRAGHDVGLEPLIALSPRVSLRGEEDILFDGELVHTTVSDAIVRYRKEGRKYDGLVRFMERLADNVSKQSRDHLYTWLNAAGLQITEDGLVIGYKGVNTNFKSVHSGTAKVNGKEITGNIPNDVGNIITMPRNKVNPDPKVGCSYGLHVGSLGYAKSFGHKTLVVTVDPRDVVAVPAENQGQKMRTCRYTVVGVWDPNKSYEAARPAEIALDDVSDVVPNEFLARLRARLNRK